MRLISLHYYHKLIFREYLIIPRFQTAEEVIRVLTETAQVPSAKSTYTDHCYTSRLCWAVLNLISGCLQSWSLNKWTLHMALVQFDKQLWNPVHGVFCLKLSLMSRMKTVLQRKQDGQLNYKSSPSTSSSSSPFALNYEHKCFPSCKQTQYFVR